MATTTTQAPEEETITLPTTTTPQMICSATAQHSCDEVEQRAYAETYFYGILTRSERIDALLEMGGSSSGRWRPYDDVVVAVPPTHWSREERMKRLEREMVGLDVTRDERDREFSASVEASSPPPPTWAIQRIETELGAMDAAGIRIYTRFHGPIAHAMFPVAFLASRGDDAIEFTLSAKYPLQAPRATRRVRYDAAATAEETVCVGGCPCKCENIGVSDTKKGSGDCGGRSKQRRSIIHDDDVVDSWTPSATLLTLWNTLNVDE